MIPLRDELPSRRRPYVTIAIIAANALVFAFQLSLGPRFYGGFVSTFGAVPALITGSRTMPMPVPPQVTILTHMFIHGGFVHLAMNMLFLWVFGDNVEDVMGHGRFLAFYIISGIAAAFGHILMNYGSTVPMVGASGAVSGVLGAYVILFPRARIVTLFFLVFLIQIVRVPALYFLAFWFILQFFYGTISFGSPSQGGVAWFAHIGGFVAGMLLVYFFRKRERMRWYRRL